MRVVWPRNQSISITAPPFVSCRALMIGAGRVGAIRCRYGTGQRSTTERGAPPGRGTAGTLTGTMSITRAGA